MMIAETQQIQQKPLQRSWLMWPSFAAIVLLVAFVLPVPDNGTIAGVPQLCAFHFTTGLPCPGCGLTRAIVCCAHGRWSEAIGYHPLGPLVFAIFIALAAIGVLGLLQPPRAERLVARASSCTDGMRWLATIVGVALIVIWLARIAGWLPRP